MNLPNKLTIFRVLLVPVYVFFQMTDILAGNGKWIALGVFIIASLTDTLDGIIARKYNLITNFGKFMDPLADKLLVCAAFICLVEQQKVAAWVIIIIISREFIISGFRLVASDDGVVIAASYWGKIKTVFQIIMVIMLIMDIKQIQIITDIVMWITVALTIISLIDYLMKNKKVLKDIK